MYYEINEETARRANDMNSMRDYRPGSATAEYRAAVDEAAALVEPLEQVIDQLKEQLRTRHILRLQQGVCTIGTGFAWSDLLTDLERTADHCSNIAICIVDSAENSMNLHHSLSVMKEESPYYKDQYAFYSEKYVLPKVSE